MFLVLIKYVDNGKLTWAVESDPFEHKVDAMKAARARAVVVPNTFAVVKIEAMLQTRTVVVETAP